MNNTVINACFQLKRTAALAISSLDDPLFNCAQIWQAIEMLHDAIHSVEDDPGRLITALHFAESVIGVTFTSAALANNDSICEVPSR